MKIKKMTSYTTYNEMKAVFEELKVECDLMFNYKYHIMDVRKWTKAAIANWRWA